MLLDFVTEILFSPFLQSYHLSFFMTKVNLKKVLNDVIYFSYIEPKIYLQLIVNKRLIFLTLFIFFLIFFYS